MRRFGREVVFPVLQFLIGGVACLDLIAADSYRVVNPTGNNSLPGYRTNPGADFQNNWSTKGGYSPAGNNWGRTSNPYSDPLGSGRGNWQPRPATPAFGGKPFEAQLPRYESQTYSIGPAPRPMKAPETIPFPKLTVPDNGASRSSFGNSSVYGSSGNSSSGIFGGGGSGKSTSEWELEHAKQMERLKWQGEYERQMEKLGLQSQNGQQGKEIKQSELYHDPVTGQTFYEREMTLELLEAYGKELLRQDRLARQERRQKRLQQAAAASSQVILNESQADYLRQLGYNFDPNTMSASEMDQKVAALANENHDADSKVNKGQSVQAQADNMERAEFWEKRGYSFDPKTTTAAEMDAKVKEREAHMDARGAGIRY